MQGKVCLVTGANGGLGRATALGMARMGATVLMGCRDQARGEQARAEVAASSGSDSVELLLLDLADQRSLRRAADELGRRHERLDVLINNAAVYRRERELSADGLELMFATNHLGPFLLTSLLLDQLRASAPARVLTISAPSTTRLNFDDLQGERRWSALHAFGASKMCNLLFTYELARRLEGSGVSANVLHPGLIKSSLMREMAAPVRWLLSAVSRSPEKAAEGPIYLASSPEIAGVSGKFFHGRRQIKSNDYSHDPEVQRRLWQESERISV